MQEFPMHALTGKHNRLGCENVGNDGRCTINKGLVVIYVTICHASIILANKCENWYRQLN